jgi:hypothetical protein
MCLPSPEGGNIQFPKRRIFMFHFFRIRTMDEVRKPINSVGFCESSHVWERGPLSLVRTIEELLEYKSSGSGLENRD